jgi:hypothetical protein
MKVQVWVTSGDYEAWQKIIPQAARDGVYDPKLKIVTPNEKASHHLDPYGEMEFNGYKDFLKFIEFIDEEIIIIPKHRRIDGDEYDMIIEIYDDCRE